VLHVYLRAQRLIHRADLPAVMSELRAGAIKPVADVEHQRVIGSRLAWMVSRILGLLPTDSRCLIRSVTLSTLLARRGIPSRVVIGVRAKPQFGAHAWVEHEGRPLLPVGDGYERLHEV